MRTVRAILKARGQCVINLAHWWAIRSGQKNLPLEKPPENSGGFDSQASFKLSEPDVVCSADRVSQLYCGDMSTCVHKPDQPCTQFDFEGVPLKEHAFFVMFDEQLRSA